MEIHDGKMCSNLTKKKLQLMVEKLENTVILHVPNLFNGLDHSVKLKQEVEEESFSLPYFHNFHGNGNMEIHISVVCSMSLTLVTFWERLDDKK